MLMFADILLPGLLHCLLCSVLFMVSFGMVTVGGNTVVIDIMPSSRRVKGLGYYGLTNNIGHVHRTDVRTFLHDGGFFHLTIFCYALGSLMLGFLSANLVKTPYKPPVKREPISLDRFILLKGMPGDQPPTLHSLRNDHQLCSHVCPEIGITQTGFFYLGWRWAWPFPVYSRESWWTGKDITQVITAWDSIWCVFSFSCWRPVYI